MERESGPAWTAENMNRKRGDTTFKQCGWCQFRGGGSYRYDAMLSGGCTLLSEYSEHRERKWHSSCVIKTLGRADLRDIIRSKRSKIEGDQESIKARRSEIADIKKLIGEARDRPPLPSARCHDHFNIDDRVYVLFEDKWNRGTVVSGYRHHDGCVSYVLDDYSASAGGWGCGFATPCVMLKKEYDYFLKRPLDFEEWLRNSDREYNGKKLPLDKYLAAIEGRK